ncbi:MAG: hypothetical protein M3046_06675 [Actinomycetota bacterium]|nr:hypothetical protein [Actinomycetota bacterium]
MEWKFVIGRGGWLRVEGPDLPVVLYVKVVADERTGRFGISELHIAGAEPLTVEGLRAVPLARLEAAVNEPWMAGTLRDALRQPETLEAAELPGAALSTVVWEPPADEEPQTLIGSGVSAEGKGGSFAAYYSNEAMVVTFPAESPSLKLKVPKTRKRPDEFYAEVAAAFSMAAATGSKPAVRIARANRQPVSTVHRWIKEARRRGLMTPARRTNTEENP